MTTAMGADIVRNAHPHAPEIQGYGHISRMPFGLWPSMP